MSTGESESESESNWKECCISKELINTQTQPYYELSCGHGFWLLALYEEVCRQKIYDSIHKRFYCPYCRQIQKEYLPAHPDTPPMYLVNTTDKKYYRPGKEFIWKPCAFPSCPNQYTSSSGYCIHHRERCFP